MEWCPPNVYLEHLDEHMQRSWGRNFPTKIRQISLCTCVYVYTILLLSNLISEPLPLSLSHPLSLPPLFKIPPLFLYAWFVIAPPPPPLLSHVTGLTSGLSVITRHRGGSLTEALISLCNGSIIIVISCTWIIHLFMTWWFDVNKKCFLESSNVILWMVARAGILSWG